MHTALEEDKPSYASKKSDDGRPKYGSRKEFFQRVWDRLHGSDGHATNTSTQAGHIVEFGSMVMVAASPGFCVPINEVVLPSGSTHSPIFRPKPIRYARSFSIEDDDEYRSVTLRGITLELDSIQKRHRSAFANSSSKNKKQKL